MSISVRHLPTLLALTPVRLCGPVISRTESLAVLTDPLRTDDMADEVRVFTAPGDQKTDGDGQFQVQVRTLFRFVYLGLFHMWLLRPSQYTKVHTFIDKNTSTSKKRRKKRIQIK